MTAARINARVDPETAKKLELLKRRTGLSASEIIRVALDHYQAEMSRADGDARAILESSGFVGCVDGPRDLSIRYKRALTDSLRRKSG